MKLQTEAETTCLSTLSEWNILAGLNVTLYIPWSSVVISFIFSHHLGYRIKKVDRSGKKALAAKRSLLYIDVNTEIELTREVNLGLLRMQDASKVTHTLAM